MKSTDFSAAVTATPHYVAVFELVKVPEWLKHSSIRYNFNTRDNPLQAGEEFYAAGGPQGSTMCRLSDHQFFNIGHSYLRFKEYRNINTKSSVPALR